MNKWLNHAEPETFQKEFCLMSEIPQKRRFANSVLNRGMTRDTAMCQDWMLPSIAPYPSRIDGMFKSIPMIPLQDIVRSRRTTKAKMDMKGSSLPLPLLIACLKTV